MPVVDSHALTPLHTFNTKQANILNQKKHLHTTLATSNVVAVPVGIRAVSITAAENREAAAAAAAAAAVAVGANADRAVAAAAEKCTHRSKN